MSKPTIRWRKAGIASLATSTLVLGASFAGAGSAFAAAGDLTAADSPKVTQGMDDQSAGDLSYEFNNSFKTNDTITFTVSPNDGAAAADCSTQSGINETVGLSGKPSATLTATDADKNGTTARTPSYTVELSSSDPDCKTVGIYDQVVVTFTQPADSNTGDTFELDLSDVKYDVGSAAKTGDVTVTATGFGAATGGSADVNAVVVNRSFMFVPLVAANPNEKGKELGTATYSESTAGAYFAEGANVVTLSVDAGVFTKDVTPKITVPSGYKVMDVTGTTEGAPKTDGTNTYKFQVVAPADEVKANVTVAGLQYDAPGTPDTAELTSTVQQATPTGGTAPTPIVDKSDVVNVVNFGRTDRAGGHDRYDTSVEAFNEAGFNTDTVVLSGGEQFPDALSANYLAGFLGTGTLLTKQNQIPDSVWNTIIDKQIKTVYITGGELAVSKAVEEKLESTHVGDNVNSTEFINVIRLSGHDRYDTNARINQFVGQGAGNTVLLAAGIAPYDSLAAGPIAYAQQYPLVLTDGKNVNDGEVEGLDNAGADNVVVLGGETVINEDVVGDLESAGFNVVRISGPTRYDTAAAIATWATEGLDANGDGDNTNDGVANNDLGFNSTTVNITNGLGFADALSAGPLAGGNAAAILLSKNASEVGDGLADYLAGKSVGVTADGTNVATLFALGSTGATEASMIEDAAKVIGTK